MRQRMQEGFQEGMRKGLLAGIEVSLEIKFGQAGLRLLPEIYKVEDVDVLRAALLAIRIVSTPDDLRRMYRTTGRIADELEVADH